MKKVTNQGTRIAGVVALVAAGAVFAWVLADAVRVDPVEAGAPLQLEVAELPAGVAAGDAGLGPPDRDRVAPEDPATWREGRSAAADRTRSDAGTEREEASSGRTGGGGDVGGALDAMQEASSFRGRATATDELLALAVANDPFRPERRPGPAYVMPWERRTPAPRREEEDEDDDEPEWPAFRIVGFALTQNGGAALVQHDDDTPILLAMGERIRGYELVAVDTLGGGAATLVGPAGQLRFPVGPPRVDDDDRRRRRRGDDDDDDDRRRAQIERQEQLQRVQQLLRRQMQQRGGNAVIRIRGGGGEELELMNLAPSPRWRWAPEAGTPVRRDGSAAGETRAPSPGTGGGL